MHFTFLLVCINTYVEKELVLICQKGRSLEFLQHELDMRVCVCVQARVYECIVECMHVNMR